MKKYLLVLLVALLLTIASAAEPGYLLENNRFSSLTYGFSLPVPEGWGAEPLTEKTVPLRLVRATGRAEVLVFVAPVPPPSADEKAGQSASAVLEKIASTRFRGFQVQSTRDMVLEGHPFREFLATGSSGTRGYRVYAGQVGARVFLFWLSANTEALAPTAKEFNAALKQIHFEVMAPSPTSGEV